MAKKPVRGRWLGRNVALSFNCLPNSKRDHGWITARNCLNKINIGDYVLVSLHGNRVGRLGEVTKLAIKEWDPLVPKSRSEPDGEIGRRILVRWDSSTGPDDRDLVVKLPENGRLNSGEVRPTVVEINIKKLKQLRQAMIPILV